ncbi:hypothetical protein J6590_086444, partial [Homalodisca vitripennis]
GSVGFVILPVDNRGPLVPPIGSCTHWDLVQSQAEAEVGNKTYSHKHFIPESV